MGILKKVIIAGTLATIVIGGAYALYQKIGKQAADHAPATSASPIAKTFEQLQNDLNQAKYKKKVLSRFAVIEGLRGLSLDDISITLLDYSYHILNDSGKAEPYFTAKCHINISKFQKDAENLRAHLKSTGRQAPIHIELPDSERIILGLIDNEKDELITFAALPKGVKPNVQFAELRKNKPEYFIISLEPGEDCTDCVLEEPYSTAVIGFDEKIKNYRKVLEVKTNRAGEAYDEVHGKYSYEDSSKVSWSDWIENAYRELIITTEREPVQVRWVRVDGEQKASEPEIKNEVKSDVTPSVKIKTDIYGWSNDELVLVEEIVDGKTTISRRESMQPSVHEIALKNGELYEERGKEEKITTTNGKVDSFLLSPGKRYVAYSIIVGYTNDVGDYEPGEKIPQVPLFHICVMDLDQKKQLKELKPDSENEPFIHMDRWISNDELLFYDADGFAVGWNYVYNATTDDLRQGDLQEQTM